MKFSQKAGIILCLITGIFLFEATRFHLANWKIFFMVLFGLNWLYFWSKLQAFVEGLFPIQVVIGSCFFFIFLLTPFFHPFEHMSHLTGAMYLFCLGLARKLMAYLVMSGFVPVLIGNSLLIVGSLLGLERINPIEAQLRKKAVWPRRVRHEKYFEKAHRKNATYLGFEVTYRQPIFLSAAERNTHVQVIGTTGSGKTLFTLFPMIRQDIEAGRGVVFIDAKGSAENAAALRRMVKGAGREKDFVLFSLTQTNAARTYNPLQHGNPSQLKDKIAASIDWSEPYYQRICESALQTLFMDLEAAGRRVTLHGLHEILGNPPPQLRNFSAIASRQAKDIRTLFSEIDLLVNTPFGGLLSEQDADIDLLDIYRKGKIAYFALDTQSYQNTAMRIGKMITQDLNTLSGIIESTFRASEKRPLAVYIDEFQAFGTSGFINTLARGRSSGFWITIAHQSMGDLDAVNDSFRRQVLENTNTKIVLRVNDPETAQLFADSIGTAKTVETTSQVRIEGEEPANIMGSLKVAHEYLVHPSEFKNLDPGQAIFKSGKRHGRISLCGHFPKPDDDEAFQIQSLMADAQPEISEEIEV